MADMTWVNELYKAYENRTLANRANFPKHLDMSSAYDIQDMVLQRKEETEALKGYKVSLTSRQTQDMFMSTSPLYGAMCDSAVLTDTVNRSDLNEPLLELELVFIVQEELKLTDSAEDIMRKCLIAPGIEVPDSRFTNWFPNLTVAEIIADSAVSGRVIYGEGKPLTYDDIANIKGELFFNGKLLAEGRSTEVLNHPVEAVQWLIKEIAHYGRTLKPGMFVSSGTFILPKPMEVGKYEARYETVGNVVLTVK
ncbi:2-keto-4-pentenoate hydratase [Macrococcus lamae]|uniref:Hydratase n=1 Tax=Macrococcus lamae TaxID=198484 RepID=A0A4R6BUR4_9STAP|nr:hydratase [Macrococcus lamae]TDM11975.1 hydratase [Macrococcus lamae]